MTLNEILTIIDGLDKTTFTVADIRKYAPGVKSNKISANLWHLHKRGLLVDTKSPSRVRTFVKPSTSILVMYAEAAAQSKEIRLGKLRGARENTPTVLPNFPPFPLGDVVFVPHEPTTRVWGATYTGEDHENIRTDRSCP